MVKKFLFVLFLFSFSFLLKSKSQIIFWTENFNNGCTSNCNAGSYTGSNGAWTVQDIGAQGSVANEWFVSCAENGQPVGSCGAGCGNNATLHIGSVPCTLCFVCPAGDCGAAYNAGPIFSGEDPTAHKRAVSPAINTSSHTNITLSFKYMERGQGTIDDFYLEYSTNGGTVWNALSNPAKTATTCASSQGLWTAYTILLPASCDNIANLQLGFVWQNNANTGSDPSVAIDDVQLTTSALAPVAEFNTPLTTFCDSTCISFNDSSVNSPTAWKWILQGATPDTVYTQNPINICYNIPGTFDVTLIATNATGSDTIIKPGYITVTACHLPVVAFTASDSILCEKSCIDFSDLSSNSPTQWQWSFPGAQPDTSSLQNPSGICYNSYGTFTVTLVAANAQGSDSAVYISFITVFQNPPQPVITQNAGVLVCSPAAGYQWYYNNVLIPGATNQVLFNPLPGDYYVIITDSNGCHSASNLLTITGFAELLNNDLLSCYPNPVNDKLVVKFNQPAKHYLISVSNMLGEKFVEIEGSEIQRGRDLIIDMKELSEGIYIIEINFGNEKFVSRFIKK